MEPDTSNTNEHHANRSSENQNAFFGNDLRDDQPVASSAEDTDGPVRSTSVRDGHGPTEAVTDGQRPTQPDTDGQEPALSQRSDLHTVTSDEAVQMFREAGVPRTRRSVTRWCKRKEGEDARLDCSKDGNDGRIYISQASIELVIEEERIKDARWRKRQDTAGDRSSQRPPEMEADGDQSREAGGEGQGSGDTTGERSKSTGALRARIEILETELRVKDGMVQFLTEGRQNDVDRIEAANRYVGRLETRVLEVDGPNSELLRLGDGRAFGEGDDGLGISRERNEEAA